MSAQKFTSLAVLAAILAAPMAGFAQEPRAPEARPPASGQSSDNAGYKLGAGDKLRITVFGEAGLTGEYAVSGAGSISFPLVGDIPAQGKSLAEVQDAIRARLAAGYLNDPRVAIEVLEYRTFYILGEVNKPGEYPYRNNMTVEQAVAMAGGYTYRANRKRFTLRSVDADPQAQTEFKNAPQKRITPGDTVTIDERFF